MIKIRNLKLFEDFNQRNATIDLLCKQYKIENYTINSDGSIDVDGNVDLYRDNLTELPLRFGRVSGFFSCAKNNISSLEGCPKHVGRNFNCSDNELTSLEFSPKVVGEKFNCSYNRLTSLKGATKDFGEFYFYRNALPKYINDNVEDIEYIIKNQDDYAIWNKDGTFNEVRFDIMMKEKDI